MRHGLIAACCLAAWGAGAETLVDFATESAQMKVVSGVYARPERQRFATEDGLTLFFDAACQADKSKWATLVVPSSIGARIDWKMRPIELVLRGQPTGRARKDIALNFCDRDGETFQIMSHANRLDAEGNLHLQYLLNEAALARHGGIWGGGAKANRRMDGAMRLAALNVHFAGTEGTGEITFRAIDALKPVASDTVARTVVSREPVSVDTGYPGAAPFRGAEALTFQVAAAVSGRATLVLSTESRGTASEGRRVRLPAVVSNGVARVDAKLSYDRQFQFMRLEDAAGRPLPVTAADGVFRQTSAEAMRLEVETKNVLHLVRDESERPELRVTNPSDTARTWKTTFRGKDVFGRQFEVPFDRTLAAGETVRVALPWPLPAKGLWRVAAEVTGEDGSVVTKETRFAFIDRHEVTPFLEKPKFRMGIHYHGSYYLPDRVDPTIAALVAAGAKFTRTDYSLMFGHVCPREGVETWETADLMMKKMRAAGLSLDIIVGGTPSWAYDPAGAWTKTNVTRRVGGRPSRPGLFRDFCEKIARRYGKQIDYYEVGNEWDIVPQLNLTHDEALRMQREAYEGVHAGCPDACVTPNGWAAATSDSLRGGMKMFPERENPGLIECFAQHPELYDAWALHVHGSAESYFKTIDERFLPMYASTPLHTRPWISNETALTSAFGEEDTVARAVWMKILFAWSRGARDYIWYNLRATGWFDGSEPGYGLISCDFHPRAGYAAFAALTAVFQGLDFDAALHSKGLRHLFAFKGAKDGFAGRVLAGWDTGDEIAMRPIRIRTDAARAELCDHMGNRTPVEIKDGVAVFPLRFTPQALLLEKATRTEIVDPQEVTSDVRRELVVDARRRSTIPLFQLNGARAVKDVYAADPTMTRRVWNGPADHSARVWLSRADAARLHVRIEVVDDIHAPGDGVEVFLTGADGATRKHVLQAASRQGVKDIYEADLPCPEPSFAFDLHVLEDDGEGLDGWLQLCNESEPPVRVRFE